LPTGQGDITNPNAWADLVGNYVPPTEFNNLNVQGGIGYPNNGDGRYWWSGDASSVTGGAIAFIGNPAFLTGNGILVWQIVQAATDGSAPELQYSQDGGATWTTVPNFGTAGTLQSALLESGSTAVALTGKTGFAVQVLNNGGTANPSATPWKVAVAIVRDQYSVVPWNATDIWDPRSYNAQAADLPNYQTLDALRQRLMYRLGFGNQVANPPPAVQQLLYGFLFDAQQALYRAWPALHTRRFFRWKIVPGIRFYSLKDNDEDVIAGFSMDQYKTIEWAGIQDNRGVWYPLEEGIAPQLYTMIQKPWRPARYEIRQAIELYPAPDQTYWLWIKGHFGLSSFVNPTDKPTIDDQLVYLQALADAKAHYGQPDSQLVQKQADNRLKRLVGATHGTNKYIPGATPVPPAVRPTLIQYQDNQQA
ncbi:MAG: hypothetical protein KGL39_09780, partial [Patescibacteria group bacterium]|nr:hypothetical protein [Patescibacteria group bacterium]